MSGNDQAMQITATGAPTAEQMQQEMAQMREQMLKMQEQSNAAVLHSQQVNAQLQAKLDMTESRARELEEAQPVLRDETQPPVTWIYPRFARNREGKFQMRNLQEFCTDSKPQIFTEVGQWMQLSAEQNDSGEAFQPPSDTTLFPYAPTFVTRITRVLDTGIRLRIYGDLCGAEPLPGYVHRHHYPERLTCACCCKPLEFTKSGLRAKHFSDVGYAPQYHEPCPRCLLRFYCNARCRRDDWFYNHQYECAKHPIFRNKHDPKSSLAKGWYSEPFATITAPQRVAKK